jgi:hypothetical protein
MAFTKTRKILSNLNDKLHEKCNGALTMELGFFSDMVTRENVSYYEKNTEPPIFLLCLNIKKAKKKHCISSISCKINEDEMEISSKTREEHERKKYNLLLRSAMVLLAQHIKNEDGTQITKVVSRAINPISVLSMIKYFNATNDELDDYMEENEIEQSEIKLEDIQTFFDEKGDLGGEEELTEEEEAALMMENEDFGDITILAIDLENEETIQKANETYINTLERIGCPEGTAKGVRKTRRTKKTKKNRTSRRSNKKTKKTTKTKKNRTTSRT